MQRASAIPRVVVLDDWERAIGRFADWSSISAVAEVTMHYVLLRGDALLEQVANAEVLVLNRDRTPLDSEVLKAAKHLRYVVFTGPRNRRIDYVALGRMGIPVSCTEGGPAIDSTCEHTWALILSLVRQLGPWTAVVSGGGWRSDTEVALPQVLRGERLGLLGCGRIGAQVAAVGLAFGMQVVTWSPNMTQERAASHGVAAVSLEELLGTSRIVSLHLVAAPELDGLLNAARFQAMRRDALFVNTSRAELVDTNAMTRALQQEELAGAALDVFPYEPLPIDHPLRGLRNVVLTPHIGFLNQTSCTLFAQGVVQAVSAWLNGDALPNLVTAA